MNDGGPAFPHLADCCQRVDESVMYSGLSIRDWFAGQALAGLCANPGGPFQANGMSGWGLVNCAADDVGEMAKVLADATLKALREVPDAK